MITPFGLWEFLRMPFGLRNAGQSFQRFMDEVLSGLDFAFCLHCQFIEKLEKMPNKTKNTVP